MKSISKILLAAALATAPADGAPLIAAGGDVSLIARDDGNLWLAGPGARVLAVGRTWTALGSISGGSAGIDADGALWTWDSRAPARLGTATDWQALAGHDGYSFAVRTDGTLWGWGNFYVGNTTVFNSSDPVRSGTASNWKSVSGTRYNLAIRTDGTLWAWGTNGHGNLGDGTTTARTEPVQVGSATTWISTATAGYTSFGIQADGSRWAWGDNSGRYGDGANSTSAQVPVKIGTDTTWRKICGNDDKIVALKTDGSLWTWRDGQGTPARIGTAGNWTDIAAGGNHFLATRSDGSIWGWGASYAGQLGVTGISSSEEPIEITGAFEPKAKFVIYQNGSAIPSQQNQGYWSLPIGILGEAQPFEIQVRNNGAATLTFTAGTVAGFTVQVPAAVPALADGTIQVTLSTALTGQINGQFTLTTNDPDRTIFTINLSGIVVSPADDTDGDGLNDAAEAKLAPFGFLWNSPQPALVASFFQKIGAAGLYRPEDVLEIPAIPSQPEIAGGSIKIPLDLGPLPLGPGNVSPISATRLRIDVPLPPEKRFLRLGSR